MNHLWIFLRPVLALASEQVLGQAKRQSRARAGGKRQSRAHDHLCSVADKLEVQLELIAQRHLKDTVKDGRYQSPANSVVQEAGIDHENETQ